MKSYLTDLNKLNNIELQTLTKVNVNDTHLKPIKCNYNKNIKKNSKF